MKTIAAVLFCLFVAGSALADDSAKKSALHDEIAKLDAEMFAAYNAHDAEKLGTFFDEKLEFYHDKDGLLTRDQVVKGLSSIFARNDGIRRELIPGSLEVYPIGNYGAIEVGAHRFCHVENGKDDCGVFQFVQVWQKQNGGWKVTRLLSYDH
ncbi:MAG TPA: nuclear transport factor 2 family protein [Thermoanaerobaculia bacterium]|jgi:hypothetical protein